MKNIMNIPSLRILCATVVLSLVMVGCGGDDDEENEGNHKPVVHINQTTATINVGTKVNLTALATDSDNDALTHKWSFSSKPTGSSATLTTDTKKATSFTADKAGKYVVEFTAKDTVGAKKTDTVTITAKDAGAITNTCTSYTEISGTYSTDKTLNGCFKVIGNIAINNNALLTIKEGSTLVFTKGTKLSIDTKGALKAIGTASKPILFTSEQKTAGYWQGIYFAYSNNVKNELAHIIVEYAGGGYGWYGNIHVTSSNSNPTRLKIRDSILRNGLRSGFFFQEGTIVSEFKNVTSTKNEEYAGELGASNLKDIDSKSNFTGNKNPYLRISAGAVSKDAIWEKFTVPVFVSTDIRISSFLTINPGSKFVFDNDKKLSVETSGSLKAIGTAKESILFTSEQKTAGYWKGIYFGHSNNVKNELAHITVEYAGGGYGWYGNIHVASSNSSPTRLKIRDSILRNGLRSGFFFQEGTIVSEFKNVTSTKNEEYAGELGASNLKDIDSKSNFTGNKKLYLRISAGAVSKDAIWEKFTVPVLVSTDIRISSFLTINAGSQFIFTNDKKISVETSGSLKAVGTTKESILFTSEQKTAGYWKGIYFGHSNNVKNQLAHITVEYAGGGYGWYGNIHVTSSNSNPTRLSIKNSTISHGIKHGIWLDKGSIVNSDIKTSNTFIDNVQADIGRPN